MKMVYTLVLTLALIVYSFECSPESVGSLHRKHNPNPSSSHAAGKQYLTDEPPAEEAPVRSRSRSPSVRPPSLEVLGYSLEQLGYIRLLPRTAQGLKFQFRRYYFPVSAPIRLRVGKHRRVPVPNEEHIVFSLSNGDVFAILDYSGFLRALYRADKNHPRVKINIMSGEVKDLTPEEIENCPAGKTHPIFPRNFIETFANEDSLQSVYNPPSEPQESLLHSRTRNSLHGPPSDEILGCPMEHLGYVRLIPCKNQNQQFEFRRYVFPTNEKLRIRMNNSTFSFASNQEYMVLSTSEGDVFAMLDSSETLRGIYRSNRNKSRIKINMRNNELINMTPDEIRDCPVGRNHPIFPDTFKKAFANYDSLRTGWNSNDNRYPASSSSAREDLRSETSLQEPPLSARADSPPGRPPSHEILGYSLAMLGYVRLVPLANRNRQFEFRKYVFPADKPIRLLLGNSIYGPVPAREHIVLSTSNGDVFAILEYTGILRGIYAINNGHSRIKMNMLSGTFEYMTELEMKECHVGRRYPIFPRWFNEAVSNEDSLQHVYH